MQDVELASAGDWARVVTLQVGEIQESVKVETERTRRSGCRSLPVRR